MGRIVRGRRFHALSLGNRHSPTTKAVRALASARVHLNAGWQDQRGTIAPMTAVLGTALIGFAALALDVSVWEDNVGVMQGAADQAALAGGLAMSKGSAAAQNEARGIAAAHGFVDGTGGVVVTPTINSTTNAITVVITQPQATFLSGVSLNAPPTASVRAVAMPAQVGTCVLALAPTASKVPPLSTNGGLNLDVSTCNIYVNLTSACDVSVSGSGRITGYDIFLGGQQNQAVCTTGGGQVKTNDQPVHYGAPAAGDPYALRSMPIPSLPCKLFDTSKNAFSPGTYCGPVKLSNTATLSPGVYIFDGGDLSVGGGAQITGTNVTLVFTSSSGKNYGGLQLSGGGSVTLTAPTQGPTDGIAIWIDKAGNGTLNSTGSNTLNITGAVYAPNAVVTWSGGGNSPCTQLIVSSLSLSGNASLKHDCGGVDVKDVSSASNYMLTE